jgi:hypothetical protein
MKEFIPAPVEARKLYMGPDFAPNEYEKVGDTYRLKPEYAEEIEQRLAVSDEELDKEDPSYQERVRRKRETRRTAPLTPEEITAAVNAYRSAEANFYAEMALREMGAWFPDEG